MLTHLCTSCEWGPWNGYFTYNNNNKCQIIIILLLIMYIFILCSSTSCVLTWYFFFFFFLNTIFDTHTDQSQTLANFTHSIIWSIKIHIQVRFAFISSNHPSFFAAKKKKATPKNLCNESTEQVCFASNLPSFLFDLQQTLMEDCHDWTVSLWHTLPM